MVLEKANGLNPSSTTRDSSPPEVGNREKSGNYFIARRQDILLPDPLVIALSVSLNRRVTFAVKISNNGETYKPEILLPQFHSFEGYTVNRWKWVDPFRAVLLALAADWNGPGTFKETSLVPAQEIVI